MRIIGKREFKEQIDGTIYTIYLYNNSLAKFQGKIYFSYAGARRALTKLTKGLVKRV